MNRLTRLVAALSIGAVSSLCGTQARAWNDAGHEIVAYLAYKDLTPPVRQRANQLLTLNPSYPTWVNSLPSATSAANRDRLVFMIASTWPDQIKRDNAYHADGSHGGNVPPTDGTADNNIGYSDLARHKYWHFIDLPFSTDGTPLPDIATSNVQERIATFRTTLASTAPDALKSYDLSWLLHLVGDVHQPLHAAARVRSGDPDGDDGGNGVTLGCAGCSTLHSYWDGAVHKNAPAATLIAFADGLPAPNPTLAAIADEGVWVQESFAAAKQYAYASPIGSGGGPYAVTDAYRNKAKAVAKDRAVLAGARLAALLNTALASASGTPIPEEHVFTNRNGHAYHKATCRYVGSSSRELTISEAQGMGRHPCGVCKPRQ